MISSNIGEVISIFISSVLGIPDGFSSIQLLWVNLVTDGLPATALSFNPSDPDVMKRPPRDRYPLGFHLPSLTPLSKEGIITRWSFTRYMAIGMYIGLTTVGVFIYWYCFYDWSPDGHPLVTFNQLRNWSECPNWTDFKVPNFGKYTFDDDPCLYFTWGKQYASTMSLTVLVMIEMFNALNALSEDKSMLVTGVFQNKFLVIAIALSTVLHCAILYVPFLMRIFETAPLSLQDWGIVLGVASPVILIDEILKFFHRRLERAELEKAKKFD